jgi:hypothetical protein
MTNTQFKKKEEKKKQIRAKPAITTIHAIPNEI